MLNRSILTSIIGFLLGCILYYTAEASTLMVLIIGGVGYFLGLILDNAEIRHQLETNNFSSNPTTQGIFPIDDIPGASTLYSQKENLTTVSIVFQIETKPQDFRLSVLKNLQDYQFRVFEDSSKTSFGLTLDYPECNYPKLLSSAVKNNEFNFDIRERSIDFQNALQKIVPGLVLCQVPYPDFFREETSISYNGTSQKISRSPPPSSPLNHTSSQPSNFPTNTPNTSCNSSALPRPKNIDPRSVYRELIDYPPSPELETRNQSKFHHKTSTHGLSKNEFSSEEEVIDESEIMEDLLTSSTNELDIPDLSPEEAKQLKNHNEKNFESFVNEESSELLSSSLVSADKLSDHDRKSSTSDESNENRKANNNESDNILTVSGESEETDKVRIDFSTHDTLNDKKTKGDDFESSIVDRIEKKTQDAISKLKTNPESQKEMGEV